MQYTVLNSSGTVTSQGNTNASGGGGSSIPSRSVIPFGTYWNNGYSANTSAAACITVLNQNGNTAGATNFLYTFERAGAIVGVNMVQAGPIAGNNTVTLNKNNTQVASLGFGANNNSAPSVPKTFANTLYTFAASDYLTVNLINDQSGNTQVSGYVTVEWTA